VINNTVIINKTVNVYKNVSINHAVTTVHSQSFATGKYKYADVQKKTFGNEKVIAGAPRIAPTRESRMSNFKQIQADKQPPRMVQQAKPEQLKQERNFVRDRNRSVFKPDQKMERRPVQIQPAKPEQRDQRQVEKQRIQAPADRQLPVKQPERQEKMNGKERERVKDQPLPSRDRRDDSLTPRDTRPGIRGQQDGDKAKSGQIAPAGPPPPQRQPDITERRKRTPEAAPPPVERRAPQQSVTPAKPDVRDSQRIERAGDTRDKGPGTGKEAPPRQQELKKQEERRKTIPEVAPAPVERRAPQQAVTPAKQEQRPSPGPQNIQRREPAGEPKGREKAVERGAGPAPEKSRKVESEQKQQQDKDESPNRPDRSDGRERERPRR
jgi:hypothetical protein